jgi:beta-galactosidase
MYYGVQYYPEQWPEERWAQDAQMMQRAGVNTVRMGEFAWSAYEPRDTKSTLGWGEIDFGWMERAITLLNQHGIQVILCTCSRTPPPWVFTRYPGVRNTRIDGHVNPYGLRYTVGLAHPEFIELSERIDRAVIEHFAGHPGIAGWQVDNEVGGFNDCFCDRCLGTFQDYLRRKYGTVERLNQRWGAHFWSFNFSDFSEVPSLINTPSGRGNPQLMLEYRRFLSDLNVDFSRSRSQMIHQIDTGKFVTTNFQSFQARHTDYFAMAETIDLPGMNHYPPRSPELILDYYRGEKGSVLVLEQLSRLAEWDTGEGWMRLWAYRALAHGACGTIFFRWRTARYGQEQHADGILPHAGQENRRYRELARMGAELAQIGARIDATHVAADTAILMGYEGRWAMEAGLKTANMQPDLDAVRFHDEFLRRNITCDVLDPHCDLSPYRLVIAPRLWLVDERMAANLRAFVERGGVLCLTAASGVVDEFNVSFAAPRPGPLAEMAGLEVSDLSPLSQDFSLDSQSVPGLQRAPASVMADEIHPGMAEVLAAYGEGWRKGLPALTRNYWGKGQVYYLGTVLVESGLQALVDLLCLQANIQPVLATPENVRAHLRVGQGLRLLFLLNQSEQPQTVALPPGWRDALSGEPCPQAALDPVGVRVLEQTIQ